MNNLATNLALLGAAKLGIAAVGGKSAIPEGYIYIRFALVIQINNLFLKVRKSRK